MLAAMSAAQKKKGAENSRRQCSASTCQELPFIRGPPCRGRTQHKADGTVLCLRNSMHNGPEAGQFHPCSSLEHPIEKYGGICQMTLGRQERRPCVDGGRNWSDVSPGQGMAGATRSQKTPEGSSPTASGERGPAHTLISDFWSASSDGIKLCCLGHPVRGLSEPAALGHTATVLHRESAVMS